MVSDRQLLDQFAVDPDLAGGKRNIPEPRLVHLRRGFPAQQRAQDRQQFFVLGCRSGRVALTEQDLNVFDGAAVNADDQLVARDSLNGGNTRVRIASVMSGAR